MSGFEYQNDEPINFELSAREIASGVISRAIGIPSNLKPLVLELLVDAAHDGVEFGEGIAALLEPGPTKLEHWVHGYLTGLADISLRPDDLI